MDIRTKKDYYSESLEEIINKYITEKRYKKFKPLLNEIFQRRAYQFDFSDEEMEKQVKQFSKNIRFILFVPSKIIGGRIFSGGYSIPFKSILFNYDAHKSMLKKFDLKNDNSKIEQYFKTLTHEVYHAIARKKGSRTTGLCIVNNEDEVIYTPTNESINECAASMTTNSQKTNETSGYNEISFFPQLLSYVINATEKELVKAGIQDRDTFDKLIYSKFPTQVKTKAKDLIHRMENYLSELYKWVNKPIGTIEKIENEKRLSDQIFEDAESLVQLQDFNDLNQQGDEFVAKKQERLINIRKLKLKNDIDILKRNKIPLETNNEEKNSEIYENLGKKDDAFRFRAWDNSEIYEMMRNAIKSKEKSGTIINAVFLILDVKGNIKRVLNKINLKRVLPSSKKKLLNDGENKIKHNFESEFDKRYKVDKEIQVSEDEFSKRIGNNENSKGTENLDNRKDVEERSSDDYDF